MTNIFTVNKSKKIKSLEKDLEQSKSYNKTLSNLNDSMRGFKHDFANILTAIGGYVQADDMEGLKKYFSALNNDCIKLNNLSALSPDVINEPAIYSLICSKYYLAQELGITINLDVFLNLQKLNVNTYDFTRILRYFI